MLSYIYQLAFRFENSHDMRPNTIYLNYEHFRQLCNEFIDSADMKCISNYLGMVVVLTDEISQPHLSSHGQVLSEQSRQPWTVATAGE